MKALIAFRANITIKNKDGKMALEEARDSSSENSKECVQVLEETSKLFEEAEKKLSCTCFDIILKQITYDHQSWHYSDMACGTIYHTKYMMPIFYND